MIRRHHLVLLTLLLTSCEKATNIKQPKALFTFNLDTIALEEEVLFSEFFSEARLVQLETNAESVLGGRVDQLRWYKGHLYLTAREWPKRLMVFDSTGSFIRQVGRHGKGPGEYRDFGEFTIDKATDLIILRDDSGKLIHYDLEGNMVAEGRLSEFFPTSDIGVYDGDILLVETPQFESDHHLVHQINTDGSITKSWFKNEGFFTKIYLGNSATLVEYGDQLRFVPPYQHMVYHFTGVTFDPYLNVTGKDALSEEEIKDEVLRLGGDVRSLRDHPASGYLGIWNFFETDQFIRFRLPGAARNYHYLFYNKTTGDARRVKKFNDDLIMNPLNIFFEATDDFVIGSLFGALAGSSRFDPDFYFERMRAANVQLSQDDQGILDNYDVENNPVLVFYRLKN